MTIDDKIRDKKLQSDINREAAKISALSSSKINKHEYLTGEKNSIIWSKKIDRTSYVYLFPFSKRFIKTMKNNWLSRKKTNIC